MSRGVQCLKEVFSIASRHARLLYRQSH